MSKVANFLFDAWRETEAELCAIEEAKRRLHEEWEALNREREARRAEKEAIEKKRAALAQVASISGWVLLVLFVLSLPGGVFGGFAILWVVFFVAIFAVARPSKVDGGHKAGGCITILIVLCCLVGVFEHLSNSPMVSCMAFLMGAGLVAGLYFGGRNAQ